MLVRVLLGYVDGVACPTSSHGRPIYGQIVTEIVSGRQMVELWPWDMPLNVKQGKRPLRQLWRPELSGVTHSQFGLSGLECLVTGGTRRWVAQRWLCEPMSYADILRGQEPDRRFGVIRPHRNQP